MKPGAEELEYRYGRETGSGSCEDTGVTAGIRDGEFFIGHHVFSRRRPPDRNRQSRYSEWTFRSPLDCLAYLRRVVIPERLREASGLRGETDIEALLDGSGYSVSLIAEELFSMIDECIASSACDPAVLEKIKQAYNGLSGFEDRVVGMITGWGFLSRRAIRQKEASFCGWDTGNLRPGGVPADFGSAGALAV